MHTTSRTAPRGFTLVELLVVIAIIGLISAVALPVVLPALNERRVSESARLVQAVLAGARDAAIRANAPRGIRLLPDPVLNPTTTPGVLAANRIVPIEPAPQYTEGLVTLGFVPNVPVGPVPPGQVQLKATQVFVDSNNLLVNPTSWYWNIRQGDKIRFNDSGPYYTIAGPMTIGPSNVVGGNPERYINTGLPNSTFPKPAEFLILVNGIDDDENGFVDDSFDGLDNNGDFIVDPLYNGLDDDGDGVIDNEYPRSLASEGVTEIEKFDGTLVDAVAQGTQIPYTIYRRPVISPGAKETTLPSGIVVDLTTYNAATVGLASNPPGPTLRPERSRLPVDPYSYYVDIMISPNGQVVQGGAGGSSGDVNSLAPSSSQPFYHFWLTEREGVVPPLWGLRSPFRVGTDQDLVINIPNPNPRGGSLTNAQGYPSSQNYLLPMPKGTLGYSGNPGYDPMPNGTLPGQNYGTTPVYLTGERRLVTLFVKTGQIVSNSIETFNVNDTSVPFYDAQTGTKETQ